MSHLIATPSNGKSTIGVVLDQELRERLDETAHANERSVGAEVRVALREHLGRDDKKEEQL
jgi:predicted transcriptional regulator